MKNTITIVGYTNIPCLKNNQIISYRRKKTYNNKKIKEFKSYIQKISKEALIEVDGLWNTKKQYSIQLSVTYGGTEIDIQNVFDIICDSLQGILYEDDKQIKKVVGEKFFEKNTWKFEIILTIL
jgi:Holliday junction resolvase RusA-like endonuclease